MEMKFLMHCFAFVAVIALALALKNPEICGLPHSLNGDGTTSCLAYLPSYSYNMVTNDCVPFIFGGCRGNANRFEILQECEDTCKE